MGTSVSLFDQPKMNVPAHIAKFFEQESNITDKVTVPSLSYEGKVWTISLNGDKTKLMKKDAEGDDVPVSVMRVVVLDYAKRRGRAYYEGTYDPAKAGAPVCWSEDGVAPDATVKEPQCGKCESCPMAAKGSKVTDNGKSVAACSQHRMLVVVPAANLGFEPLRLKIAVTSDWDKNSPDLEAQNWFAFNNYTDMLKSKGAGHTAALVTKIKFDPNTAYPKLVFSADRWLSDDELAVVAPVIKSDKVKGLIAGTWTPAGADGVANAAPAAKDDDAPTSVSTHASDALIAKAAEEAAAAKVKAEAAAAAKAEKAAAKAKAEAEAAAAKKAADEAKAAETNPLAGVNFGDDDDEAPVIEAKATSKVVTDKASAAGALPADVSALLAEWGADD